MLPLVMVTYVHHMDYKCTLTEYSALRPWRYKSAGTVRWMQWPPSWTCFTFLLSTLQRYREGGVYFKDFLYSTTLPSPSLPSPPSRLLPFHPLHSPPLRSRPLKSSYRVWGALQAPPVGSGAEPQPNFEFWCILALKSDIWWQQF